MQRNPILIFALMFLCSKVVAEERPSSCIKAASRTTACPHQIYRAVQFPNMEKPAVRCICVTDFMPLLTEPENTEQRLAQHRLKQQFKAQLPYDIEPVLQVLRRER